MTKSSRIEGENGALEITQTHDGSRIGEIYLDMQSGDGAGALDMVTVRPPFFGGIYDHAHSAFAEASAPGDSVASRRRPPLVMISDDFGIDGGFSYFEIGSDAEGFEASITHVNNPASRSGPVHFAGEAAQGRLNAIYNALTKDQQKMKSILAGHLDKKQGYLYEALSKTAWDQATGDHLGFDKIKEAGVFLLKAGIPLPE